MQVFNQGFFSTYFASKALWLGCTSYRIRQTEWAIKTGMLNLSGIFCLNASEMANVGFYHIDITGVELVRNFLMESVRNMLENVRNFCIYNRRAEIARKCPKFGWKLSEILLSCSPLPILVTNT